jgi:hypothetical protein
MSMAPRDFPDDDDDGDHGQPDPHDDADLGFDAGPPSPAGALDPLAAFLKELEDLDSMSGPDIMAAMADLPESGTLRCRPSCPGGGTSRLRWYVMTSYIDI